ncbi:MAG TPA: agmatine deiminase family protein [Jatrophihabitans sp.]
MSYMPAESTPHAARRMPPEWAPHERCWMAFPPSNETFGADGGDDLHRARVAWSAVATTIAKYEPVTLIAGSGQTSIARDYTGDHANITFVERPLDDSWMRDIGPTFTVEADGSLAAVDWVFNGWGAQEWATWEKDAAIATAVAELATANGEAVPVRHSVLTNEGGGIHVDGEGTVLLTDTVQLDPGRNRDWTRAAVEDEIHAQLGTQKAIWLPRGLTRDYERFGTRGHVDIVATFTSPGVVAVHAQRSPAHPDYEVSRAILALLGAATDVHGNPLHVEEIPAPIVLEHDGLPTDFSYINHYVGNGFLVVGTFDDPADEVAVDLLAALYPGRTIETVDGTAIFANGGGVHCITQQQPAVTPSWAATSADATGCR